MCLLFHLQGYGLWGAKIVNSYKYNLKFINASYTFINVKRYL